MAGTAKKGSVRKRYLRAAIGRFYRITLGGKSFFARVRRHKGQPELELLDEHGVHVERITAGDLTPELLTKFGVSA